MFPLFKKRIVISSKDRSADVLAKDAPVFVLYQEMLLQPRPELATSCMCANAHYSICSVRSLSILKQHIHPIERQVAHVKRESEAG